MIQPPQQDNSMYSYSEVRSIESNGTYGQVNTHSFVNLKLQSCMHLVASPTEAMCFCVDKHWRWHLNIIVTTNVHPNLKHKQL